MSMKTNVRRKLFAQKANAEYRNVQGVSVDSDGFVVIAEPSSHMTPRQALIHAAHLITVADPKPDSQEFLEVFARVAEIGRPDRSERRKAATRG